MKNTSKHAQSAFLLGLAALALPGCVVVRDPYAASSFQYRKQPAASVTVGGHVVAIKMHAEQSRILMTSRGGATGGAALQSALFGMPDEDQTTAPYSMWKDAALAFFEGSGCVITDTYRLQPMTWEARYTCPAGSTPPRIGQHMAK